MFAACVLIAWAFVHPFWIGLSAAIAATLTEWSCGDVGILRFADDNWTIPLVSIAVVFGLLAITGGL